MERAAALGSVVGPTGSEVPSDQDQKFHRLWVKFRELRKRGVVPIAFRPLPDAEKEAAGVSVFSPLLIPGLFQTEEYARRVLGSGLQPDKVDELLALRMSRQEILTRPDAPWVFLLIRAAVIRDIWPEGRPAQCKRLLDAASHPKISIQVLPDGTPVYQSSGFLLLGLHIEEYGESTYISDISEQRTVSARPIDIRNVL